MREDCSGSEPIRRGHTAQEPQGKRCGVKTRAGHILRKYSELFCPKFGVRTSRIWTAVWAHTHTHLSGVFESYKPRGLIGVLEGSQEITGAVLRNVTLGISQDSDRHVALDAAQ